MKLKQRFNNLIVVMILRNFFVLAYWLGRLVFFIPKLLLNRQLKVFIINIAIYFLKIFLKLTKSINVIKYKLLNVYVACVERVKFNNFLYKLKPNLKFSFWKRSLVFGFILFFIVIIPVKAASYLVFISKIKSQIVEQVKGAFGGVILAKEAASDKNFLVAGQEFHNASQNLINAQTDLSQINKVLLSLLSIVPSNKAKLASHGQNLLNASQAATELGQNLSEMMNSLEIKDQDNKLGLILNTFSVNSKIALEKIKVINTELNDVSVDEFPSEYQSQVRLLKNKAIFLEKSLVELMDVTEKLKIVLGFDMSKRYLLIFQNNTEMRATGGFIGSFAIIDFKNGKINKIDVPKGGTYDTEAGLKELVKAPQPLWLVNPLWHMWDCNWWPDWSISAKKIAWYYEHSGGSTVDGVISFTPAVMEKLLEITGPIDMGSEYGVVIDANNFWLTVQTIAEQKPDKTKEPKKIIGDLFPKLLERLPEKLKNKESLLKLLSIAEEVLDQKQVLLYFNDANIQEKVNQLNWSGQLKDVSQDYLMVVNTNIAGGKSDRQINQTIRHQVELLADGSLIDNLEIIRKHTGSRRDLFSGLRNVNWLRVYVPQGSQLISAEGFSQPAAHYFEQPNENWLDDPLLANENKALIDKDSLTKIYKESNKTVFANWSMVDPGESTTIKIKYKLPFKLDDVKNNDNGFLNNFINNKKVNRYSLLVQKQSGSYNTYLEQSFKFTNKLKSNWSYPDQYCRNEECYFSKELDVDKNFATILIEK